MIYLKQEGGKYSSGLKLSVQQRSGGTSLTIKALVTCRGQHLANLVVLLHNDPLSTIL